MQGDYVYFRTEELFEVFFYIHQCTIVGFTQLQANINVTPFPLFPTCNRTEKAEGDNAILLGRTGFEVT